MKTSTTKAGTFGYIRYYSKYLGWIKTAGVKKTSLSTIATATINKYDLSGVVLLNSAGPTHQVVLARGFANKTDGVLNTSDGTVVYPLASLQKAMTGAIIQQLISSGKLSPYSKLSSFYPGVKYSNSITIQRMLTMTSGIENNDYTPSSNLSESKAFSTIQSKLVSTGTSSYHYSDANYVLLAGIISKITKKSYASNLQSRILGPMNMKNTFIAGASMGSKFIPESYKTNGYGTARKLSVARQTGIPGAGNLYTTVQDFAAFENGLVNGKILTLSQYNQLLSYGSYYSGGSYVNVSGIKHTHGAFGGTGFFTDIYSDVNNYHLAIVFLNEPLKGNYDTKQFVAIMYKLAKYY